MLPACRDEQEIPQDMSDAELFFEYCGEDGRLVGDLWQDDTWNNSFCKLCVWMLFVSSASSFVHPKRSRPFEQSTVLQAEMELVLEYLIGSSSVRSAVENSGWNRLLEVYQRCLANQLDWVWAKTVVDGAVWSLARGKTVFLFNFGVTGFVQWLKDCVLYSSRWTRSCLLVLGPL